MESLCMDGLPTWIVMGACFIFIKKKLTNVLKSNVRVVPHDFRSHKHPLVLIL
jgi:hypothetical protein